MRTRTIEFLVGLFIVAGGASMVYLALNVSGLTTDGTQSYQLKAHFANIGGLTSRAKVSVAGVTIGQVNSIILDREEKSALVTMDINKDVDYLPADTSASILTAGLLGEKYIGLLLGADEEVLTNGDLIYDTQSAIVLEDLIGQFVMGMGTEKK